ncbi:flavin reductase family protein [Mesorhizobium australicum]|uniref:NADH-FMN oxidoreductase RutF, flavin reductase (DIM6/NTAB) family n=1 Tax=Mesorhizobium australicum TaxID=536018 RepID=A0A1X7NKM7_9HYPH|nr:flavin reductase family protein [Mesorhizobium australicum]SMH38041.1 NADH-FMN oxidoreductase RutF, flavin reductase (DIM6/NTAB) family [Mesorhizobium australicum]
MVQDISSANTISEIDPDCFRTILRSAAASVVVITTCADGELHGMTATAFSSVSADPPSVLIVVNRTTRSHSRLLRSGRFAINVLAEDQEWIGQRFAGKIEDQFSGVGHIATAEGLPVLTGCAAHMECRTQETVDVGTHTIFVGRVVAGKAEPAAPLLYHDGRFKALAPSREAS